MRYFYVKITGGTSAGPYNIYYDTVGSNTFATGNTTGSNAISISYSALTNGLGFPVQIPDSATSILLVNTTGKGDECEPIVYTLGSPPVSLPNLCFEVRRGYLGSLTQYNFTLTDQTYNSKPVWSSSTYNVKWDSSNQYWFVENWQSGQMVNSNPATPPIAGWTIFGNQDTVTVREGTCQVSPFGIKTVNITNPTCLNAGCSGAIEIQIENGAQPILYSVNNGTTTSSSPLFSNLCPSSYTVWAKDANNLISTQTVTVPVGTGITPYTLKLETTTTTLQQGNNGLGQPFIIKAFEFVVRVKDVNNNNITQLPAGTLINFDLFQSNFFYRTTTINSGTVQRVVSIEKNGLPITSSESVISTSTNDTRQGCQANTVYNTTTQKLVSIQIQNSDVVSGSVITTLTKIQRENCSQVTSVDNVELDNPRVQGCTCCSITSIKESPSMQSIL
jgi:hypothetical protein